MFNVFLLFVSIVAAVLAVFFIRNYSARYPRLIGLLFVGLMAFIFIAAAMKD